MKTIKKVAAVTSGVAAVAALTVSSPVWAPIIGGVALLSTGISISATTISWYQDKNPYESQTIKKYAGELTIDVAPAGLGRLSKALGGGKTLIKMASETKLANSVAAVIDIEVAAYSVGMGVKDTTELLFKPNQSSKNNPKTFSDRKQRPKK